MKQARQGDVFIERVKSIPEGAVPAKRVNGAWVLAEGEATGHAHTIKQDYGELFEKDGTLYLKVDAPAPLKHQEHKTVTIPAGVYRVTRQREWSDAQEPRPVID